MSKFSRFALWMTLLIATLFVLSMVVGAVQIPFRQVVRILFLPETTLQADPTIKPSWIYIVIQSRLPQAITAMLCGAALAACGLMMQTAFHNPLAGPSVFGINSGASLGVALVMLLFGGSLTAGSVSLTGFVAVLTAAFIGAMAVMALILLFSTMVRNNVMLLIIGIMIGYLTGSAISLLNFFSTEQGVQSYMIWGLGNFGGVSLGQLPWFSITVIVGLLAAMALSKALNALLLGDQYAENLGFNIQRVRNNLLLVTGLLTAITTAYCGPIVFIGMAVPHVARMLLSTDNHHHLMPATILTGAAVALLCNVICVSPGAQGVIPLNAVTPVMGAPVIIYVILKQKRDM